MQGQATGVTLHRDQVTKALDNLECRWQNGSESKNTIATHMLTFMVQGIFSNLQFAFAHFPSEGVSAVQIFPLAWDAVRNLEEKGFRVMMMTCDGASSNRMFIGMHSSQKQNGDITYKTTHPYSEDGRDIYFMSDVPHLIKTTLNCRSLSFGHSHTRALWV